MYYTYIAECSDHTLYTGYTNDIKKRENTHNTGKGAKYTRTRLPIHIIYYEEYQTKQEAMSREYHIKRLSRSEKIKMIEERNRRIMKVALAQMDIVWEDIEANVKKAEECFIRAKEKSADLIIFPEMSLTGFTMNVKKFEKESKKQIDFFSEMSIKYTLPVIFGYMEPVPEKERQEGGKNYYNKLAFIKNGQRILDYTKIHPFTFGSEGKDFRGGDHISCCEFKESIIGAFICYDLRFPEVFQISSSKSEIICVIAEWPKSRIADWDALLKARAIENQCYIIGVNRTGEGDGLVYNGHSAVYGPMGQLCTEISEKENVIFCDVDPGNVRYARERMPLKSDRREELYRRIKLS